MTPTTHPEQGASSLAGASAAKQAVLSTLSEFLAFKLGGEEYAIDILKVQEIRSYEVPTRMVNAPDFVKGVINLRGVIVPIVDMRTRFNLRDAVFDGSTVVIVLNIGQQVVGLVVDSVSDVITLAPGDMRPAPEFTGAIDQGSVLAIGTIQGRMLIVLDINKLVASETLGLLNNTVH